MAILDFFATPEALTYWYAGAEGKQWDYVDGVPTLKDAFMSAGATDLISANSESEEPSPLTETAAACGPTAIQPIFSTTLK
jgi:hypothetical protein